MKTFLTIYTSVMIMYTCYCAAFGPPYNDAYGRLVHAAYCMSSNTAPWATCH
jgi:hypothetical protein